MVQGQLTDARDSPLEFLEREVDVRAESGRIVIEERRTRAAHVWRRGRSTVTYIVRDRALEHR
jgi:hypothetical protein